MKLMFASDIHGSYYYAQKTVEAYREEKAEKLILLGDILYHGPRNDLPKDYAPKKVIELLNGIKNDTLMSASDEVKAKLKTIPKILPNAELFSINLNFLTGDDLPDWLLYHPRFARFDPFTLIYTQDSGKDMKGNIPGFKNEPSNLEWFYERYPKARPTLTDN